MIGIGPELGHEGRFSDVNLCGFTRAQFSHTASLLWIWSEETLKRGYPERA